MAIYKYPIIKKVDLFLSLLAHYQINGLCPSTIEFIYKYRYRVTDFDQGIKYLKEHLRNVAQAIDENASIVENLFNDEINFYNPGDMAYSFELLKRNLSKCLSRCTKANLLLVSDAISLFSSNYLLFKLNTLNKKIRYVI